MNFFLNFFSKNAKYFLLGIVFSIYTNFFYNTYAILIRGYEERTLLSYGYGCDKYAYGFIKMVKEKYINNNQISIINFKNLPAPNSIFDNLVSDPKKINLILLNYNFKKNLNDYGININNYRIIEKEDNCYFLKKND